MSTIQNIFIACCLLLIFQNGVLRAQKLYPENPDEFINKFIGLADSTAQQFNTLWNSKKLTAEEKRQFISTANQMSRKKYAYNPYQLLLAQIVIHIKEDESPVNISLPEFYGILKECIENIPSQNVIRFLIFMEDFLQTGKLFENPNTSKYWISTQKQITLIYNYSPVIRIANTNLKYITPQDSIVLYNTNGDFYPIPSMFVGVGGKVTWERVKLDPNTVYAELDSFLLPIKEGGIKAENVSFYYKSKFPNPIKGTFQDEVVSYNDYTQARFPFFQSYDLVNEISKPEDYYVYWGGFTLRGMHTEGSGSVNQNATIKIVKNRQVPIKVQAQNFTMESDLIASDNASVTIYLIDKNGRRDSIYHPSVDFKYKIPERKISLWRNPKSADNRVRAPFMNSYQNFEMLFEVLYFNLDEAYIYLTNIIDRLNNPAVLQSADFFSRGYFKDSKGILTSHPVTMANNYAKDFPDRPLFLNDLAAYMKQPPQSVQTVVMDLTYLGYFEYHPNTQEIVLTERGKKMAEAAGKRKDFDSMHIQSTIPGGYNAKLDVSTFELVMRGIPKFYIGDSVNVAIEAQDSVITFLKNRDMKFNGKVEGGRADFYGKNFYFNYNDYLIHMNELDSMRYITGSKEERQKEKFIRFEPKAGEQLAGILYIEKDDNKNGMKRNPEYPIFNCKTTSYSYWDAPHIRKGVYHRDKFYFEVYPYTIDSLDALDLKTLVFGGKFYSNIFPVFEETLRVQPDYSMGFTTYFPNGSTVYQKEGDAKFYNELRLDDNGLVGNGKIDYLASSGESNEFVFYPDSVRSIEANFTVKPGLLKGISYSSLFGNLVDYKWHPYKDELIVESKVTPFEIYDKFALLTGTAVMKPKGLEGRGNLTVENGLIVSKYFSFEEQKFKSDTSSFRLTTPGGGKDYFTIRDITFNYDVPNKKAAFSSNLRGITAAEFPYNNYTTSILEGKWNTPDGYIELIAPPGGNPQDFYFLSTAPELGSIIFTAKGAMFQTSTKQLDITGIPFILVADAQIYPDSGRVRIKEIGDMETLRKAGIVANTSTKYHTFSDGTIDIKSRTSYNGMASMNYVDAKNHEQNLTYNVSVDEQNRTIGLSNITEQQNFTLLPRIQFTGTASLFAPEKFQQFTGNIRLLLKEGKTTSWMKYDEKVNPDSNYIPLKNPTSELGFPLAIGFHFRQDFLTPYYTFLAVKDRGADADIITAEDALAYDDVTQEFRAGSRQRLGGKSLFGNMLRYNDEKGKIIAEGILNLPMRTGQLEMKTAGSLTHNLKNKTFIANVMWGMQIDLPKSAYEILINNFRNGLPSAKEANFRTPEFAMRLTQFLGDKKADRVITDAKSIPASNVDLGLDYFFALDDVNLAWQDTFRTFYSTKPFVLASLNRQYINKYVNGYIEIMPGVESDTIKIYMQLSPDAWVFFKLSKNLAQVASTFGDFNNIITEESPSGKAGGPIKTPPNYIFVPMETWEKEIFVKQFVKNYRGVKSP